MTKRFLGMGLPGLVLVTAFGFGGWAVITVEDLPDHGVATQPLALDFVVRQHGRTPLTDLTPKVEARSGGLETVAVATPAKEPGHYTAKLVLPKSGEWTITLHSGFGNSRTTLLPLNVVDVAGKAPLLSEVERGRRLFVAKGCVTCHVHREVSPTAVVEAGPELTYKRYQADYLTRYLADPSIAPTNRTGDKMPNLGLKRLEIASLVAFINTERQASSGQ